MHLRQALVLFYFLSYFSGISAQSVHWASKVISFSSQYGKKEYSAQQALGVPNAIFNTRLHHMAWVPKKEMSPLGEYIQVSFGKAMAIRQVAVAESLNPGAIARIWLFDEEGNKYKIYENKKSENYFRPARLFRHTFPLTSYKVASVKVELNTRAVQGSNQIDAIGISDSDTPIKARVEEVKYKEEVARAENLGPQVNSPYAERLPIISPDGQTLYFARKYHPSNIGESNNDDIWVSQRLPDGQWSKAVNMGEPLNNVLHNFVISVNPTGDVLYLANDYRGREKDAVSVAQGYGKSWSKPQLLPIPGHYNDNEFVGYHISTDGTILMLAVQRKDSYGDRDIYVSFQKNNGQWSIPKNLGPVINTIGIESSVFLAADGKTIYFSSNGHAGFGGLDMYMSRRLDNSWTNWSKPQNLGSQINSKRNDYNYTIPASGEFAYFSRDDARGMSDLYRIKLPKEVQPEPVMLLSGQVIDAETNQPMDATLKYENLGLEKKDRETGALAGQFQVVLPYGEDVGLHAEAEGYFAISENMELGDDWLEEVDEETPENEPNSKANFIAPKEKPKYQEVKQDILMVPIKVGQIIPMNNVFFEANEASLKDVSSAELERVLGFLKKNPKLIVEVGGHTNGWCSHEFASELSRDRAKVVREYFINQGIAENRIQYRGYGKTAPIATNDTIAGRKKNQRVELQILEILQ